MSNKISADAANALLGHLYPDDFQFDILFFYVDDQAALEMAGEWPAPYGFHANVLAEIRENYAPLALFVDFLFTHDRDDPTLSSLIAELSRFGRRPQGPIPVFLAVGAPSVWSNDGIRGEFLALADEPHVHLVRVGHELGAAEWSYPFKVDETGGEHDAEPGHPVRAGRAFPSAAWALYRELCPEAPGARRLPCREPLAEGEHGRSASFDVLWGRGPAELTRRSYLGCDGPRSSLAAFAAALVNGRRDALDSCPYTASVHIRALYDREVRTDPALKGKVVIYGGALETSKDVLRAPTVRHPIPGAHLHAMALNNLLVFGNDFKAHRTRVFGVPVGPKVVNIAALTFTLFIFWLVRDGELILARRWHVSRWVIVIVRGVTFVLIVSLVGSVCFFWLDMAPINWIGIIAVASIVTGGINSLLTLAVDADGAPEGSPGAEPLAEEVKRSQGPSVHRRQA